MKQKKIVIGFPYTSSVERDMKMFYNSLNEKDYRHYAALEAKNYIILDSAVEPVARAVKLMKMYEIFGNFFSPYGWYGYKKIFQKSHTDSND